MPAVWLAVLCSSASAQTPPQELTSSQVQRYDAESIPIGGPFPGLLLIPNAQPNYRDEKYNKPYHLACHVYAATPGGSGGGDTLFRRRFLVCATDREALPFTKLVARLLLLIYGERHGRIRDDHPENRPTVNVWLTERVEPGLSPDTGGEQFQNQIYLYNIHRERTPIEWAREIAHEYGHYGLPGISGFLKPEEWANGVLGERLFLKWIRDDVKAGRLHDSDLPFVTSALLDEYSAGVIWPLVRPILREGMDATAITRTTARGMDYYTGLALYIDTLYGTSVLVGAMLDTRSASSITFPHAPDFLTGFTRTLKGESVLTLNLPAVGAAEKENTIYFYLPAGAWTVGNQGSVASWRMAAVPKAGLTVAGKLVTAFKGGWYAVSYVRKADSTEPARMIFRRRP